MPYRAVCRVCCILVSYKNRLIFHNQFEVLLKPAPINSLDLFKKSIYQIYKYNIKMELIESNWSQPSLGAYGIGYECRINGLEVAQITYFTKYWLASVFERRL